MGSAAGTTIDVELQTRARFGKLDGGRDYSWLLGGEGLPPLLRSACEPLARAAANASTCIALVAEEGGRAWLVRAYSSGVDNAFRPITALEVAEVLAPYPLPLTHWLGLAAISIQQPERIGASNAFSISVPPPQSEALEPDPRIGVRARLGIPLTTSSRVALSLLNPALWKYSGVCFAVRGKNMPLVEWAPEFAPFLCVNFADPLLSPEDREVLELAERRQISSEEWEQLHRLDRGRLLQAFRWVAGDGGALPGASDSDPLMHWLVAYRAADYHGSRLLSRLRLDLHSQTLPRAVVESTARDLSPRAVDFVCDVMSGRRPDPSPSVVEELARADYLGDETLIPLSLWAGLAQVSPSIADVALRRFAALGVNEPTARFVLDLDDADETRSDRRFTHILEAARLADGMSLPPPKRRLIGTLEGAHDPAQLDLLREVGIVYGGWADALTLLVNEGILPPPAVLTASEMLAAIRIRSQVLGLRHALFETLVKLLDVGRAAEARELFKAADAHSHTSLSAGARQAMASRIGLTSAPAASPLPPLAELAELARAGLIRPEDISLNEDDAPNLARYAALWPSTAPLVALLEGEDGHDDAPSIPVIPESWIGAARRAVTPRQVACWLEKFAPSLRDAGRCWAARLRGLDPAVLETLRGEGEALPDQRDVSRHIAWLAALMASVERAAKLRGLGGLALSGATHGNESLAIDLVALLLPLADARAREFVLHALSRIGPLPPPEHVPTDVALALLPSLDAGALIDAVFASQEVELSRDPAVCRALVERARHSGAMCPARRYTTAQLRRHLPLAAALSRVPGWEELSPDAAARADYVLGLMRRLDVSQDDLRSPRPAGTDEPELPAKPAEETL